MPLHFHSSLRSLFLPLDWRKRWLDAKVPLPPLTARNKQQCQLHRLEERLRFPASPMPRLLVVASRKRRSAGKPIDIDRNGDKTTQETLPTLRRPSPGIHPSDLNKNRSAQGWQ